MPWDDVSQPIALYCQNIMNKQHVCIFMLHQEFSHLPECSKEMRVFNSLISEERERIQNITFWTKVI